MSTTFKPGDDVVAVEHVDSTRQPRKGGIVHPATVAAIDACAIQVRYTDPAVFGGKPDVFWRDSRWRAWDGEFRWRLEPAKEAAT